MLEELEGLKVLRFAVGRFVVGRQLTLPVVVVYNRSNRLRFKYFELLVLLDVLEVKFSICMLVMSVITWT